VERKKAKQLLVESEIKYRTLVEKSIQGTLITKTSPLQLVFANSAMGKILGYSTDELRSLSPLGIAGLIHDEDKAIFFSRLETRMHGEPSDSSLEFRAVRKDGSIIWLEAFANRIEYLGEPAVQGMFLDITERKKEEALIKEDADDWVRIFNATDDLSFVMDKENRIVKVNKRTCDFLNKKPEELIGKHCYEVMHGTDKPWVNCPCKKAQKTGQSASSEVDDTHIGMPLRVSVSPVPNEKGELVEFVHIARSLQEQKS
jgi:PAS domain S-box-containing protein